MSLRGECGMYIYSTEKRKEYAAIIDKNLRATECSRIMQEAEVMSGELKCMREKTGVHNNKCSDKKVSLVRVGSSYMDPVTGEVHKEDRWGVDEFEDKVEEKRRQLGEKLDDAMECVVGVVREERTRRLRVNTGNRRNGWSVMYAKVIADVNELVAIADEGCGATPAKLKELMDRMGKLNEVLDINLDCTGMSQSKISKYIKHAAKKFLSTMHGRTRNKLRQGAQVVQKVGEAVVQGISLRAQKRTKHELLKHERNMEKIRIAGK